MKQYDQISEKKDISKFSKEIASWDDAHREGFIGDICYYLKEARVAAKYDALITSMQNESCSDPDRNSMAAFLLWGRRVSGTLREGLGVVQGFSDSFLSKKSFIKLSKFFLNDTSLYPAYLYVLSSKVLPHNPVLLFGQEFTNSTIASRLVFGDRYTEEEVAPLLQGFNIVDEDPIANYYLCQCDEGVQPVLSPLQIIIFNGILQSHEACSTTVFLCSNARFVKIAWSENHFLNPACPHLHRMVFDKSPDEIHPILMEKLQVVAEKSGLKNQDFFLKLVSWAEQHNCRVLLAVLFENKIILDVMAQSEFSNESIAFITLFSRDLHDGSASTKLVKRQIDAMGRRRLMLFSDVFRYQHNKTTLFHDLIDKKIIDYVDWVQEFGLSFLGRESVVDALCIQKRSGLAGANTALSEVVFDDGYDLDYLKSIWLTGCFLNSECPLVQAVCDGGYSITATSLEKLSFVLEHSSIPKHMQSRMLFIGELDYFKSNWKEAYGLNSDCPVLQTELFSRSYVNIAAKVKDKISHLYSLVNKKNTVVFLQKLTVWAAEGSRDDHFLDCALGDANKKVLLTDQLVFTPIVKALDEQGRLVKLRELVDFLKNSCGSTFTSVYMSKHHCSRTVRTLLSVDDVSDSDLEQQWFLDALQRVIEAYQSKNPLSTSQAIIAAFIEHNPSTKERVCEIILEHDLCFIEQSQQLRMLLVKYVFFSIESLKSTMRAGVDANPALQKRRFVRRTIGIIPCLLANPYYHSTEGSAKGVDPAVADLSAATAKVAAGPAAMVAASHGGGAHFDAAACVAIPVAATVPVTLFGHAPMAPVSGGGASSTVAAVAAHNDGEPAASLGAVVVAVPVAAYPAVPEVTP